MGLFRGRRKALAWLLAGLIALSILGGLTLYRPFASKGSVATASPPEDADEVAPPPKLPGKLVTFLVMGVDKGPTDHGRSDSMILVSYDPNTQQLAALSLARDTWVQIPGRGFDKVNHSYAFGGERLSIQTVQRFLGIPIDHYITLSYPGFMKIVDALGGIEVDVPKRMYYLDPYDDAMGPDGLIIDIYAGQQHMDGLTALKYSRFRADEEGDLGRIKRQQQVIKELMKAAAKPATIRRIPQLIPALASAFETDLTVAEMLRFGAGAPEALGRPLKTGSVGGQERLLSDVFYFIPDLVEVRTTAYEVLVGKAPPDDFIAKAREEQANYAMRLEEAIAEDARYHREREAANPEGDEGVSVPDGDAEDEDGESTGTVDSVRERPSTIPSAPGSSDDDELTATSPTPAPFTVAVIDASGRGLGMQYTLRLLAAGIDVVSTTTAEGHVGVTMAIDRVGIPGVAERMAGVLPHLLVIEALDSTASASVELVLGTDLIE